MHKDTGLVTGPDSPFHNRPLSPRDLNTTKDLHTTTSSQLLGLPTNMTTLSPPPGFGVPRQLSPPQPRQQSPPQPQVEKLKRSMGKRVSWATGENMCQIRLFVAEDAPAMSGSVQDQLQAKQTRNLHMFNSNVPVSAQDAPPGFGGVPVKSQPDHMVLAAIVPQISWKQPSVVHLDPTWHVMAGAASLETGVQKQREVRILEAVYPRPSSIPESPAEPLEAEEPYDEKNIPQIPLVPLEEEDVPDGSPTLSSGPRYVSQGSSGQVAGVQTKGLLDGRAEKVKPYTGNNLPVPMQEILNSRKDPAWRDASVGSTARPSVVDHSSNVLSGRPPLAGPRTDAHTNFKHISVEPDVQAAASAAFAALSKSQEMGSMIDNELLIQILSDPSLIHSLTSKSPFPIPTNSKPELSSSMNLNGVSRVPDIINQAQLMNGIIGRANHWVNPPSTSYLSMPAGGQEGHGSRSSQSYINAAGDRFQRTQGPEDRPSTFLPGAMGNGPSTLLPGAVGNGQLFTDSTNGGRVGLGQLPRPSKSSDPHPPGFSSSKANGNGILPLSFSSKSTSQVGPQTGGPPQIGAAGATSSRPLSRLDEQYFKSLIMQHGSANDAALGRVVSDKDNIGARPGNIYSTPDLKRWYGKEQLDAGRQPERNGREQRQENERIGSGSGAETAAPRAKSRKVCIYFGTARGCRNGDNCAFVHELGDAEKKTERWRSAPTQQVPYAKRLKVDG